MLSLNPQDAAAILLSLKVAVAATIITVPLGFCVAYLLAMTNIRGKAVIEGVINLPLYCHQL